MSSLERCDVIVIGAGMSGLAAGIRLAYFGKRVVVLERHALWGGLNSFYKQGGRRFDSGLHALTNYVPRGTRHAPLTKLLRQLRLAHDDLDLAEQSWSEVVLPGVRLRFANALGLLCEDVAAAFPTERDGFAQLVAAVRAAEPFGAHAPRRSGRAFVSQFVRDPLLVEALMLPILYYGSATEHDLDESMLVIMFRSIYLEGFARPVGGVRTLLDLLLRRLRESGGELRTNCGVERILVDHGRARGVLLDDGTLLEADEILSSAGWVETQALAGQTSANADEPWMSVMEALVVTSAPLKTLGHGAVMTFFSTRAEPRWARPDGAVDLTSGVVCAADNYVRHEFGSHGLMRVTCIADPRRWLTLPKEEYERAKAQSVTAMLDASSHFVPDPRPHALQADAFTPRTIAHYTGHAAGGVYGSPRKHHDGTTGIQNLHLIGNDQGLVGVIGAMLSGVTMANMHVLAAEANG